ncbi:unnamed protein product [Mytilus edulis]|uniref:Uncharacterized protein n=1 Tax=Mytilus edulis TaxID=6550 RepID=A0A8S3U0K4_MYTED|nr:unnamed protein product [Mytilus edulis]
MSVKLDPIFNKTQLDETEGTSIEDQTFLNIMSSGFFKQDDGHWIAPLPFKPNKPSLENNKQIAERRAKSFDMNLRCNSVKRTHVLEFMQKLLDREHAQIAPKLSPECPSILSPSSLLTMKTSPDVKPFPLFGPKDMLKSQWKCAQGLAEEFWRRWKPNIFMNFRFVQSGKLTVVIYKLVT